MAAREPVEDRHNMLDELGCRVRQILAPYRQFHAVRRPCRANQVHFAEPAVVCACYDVPTQPLTCALESNTIFFY